MLFAAIFRHTLIFSMLFFFRLFSLAATPLPLFPSFRDACYMLATLLALDAYALCLMMRAAAQRWRAIDIYERAERAVIVDVDDDMRASIDDEILRRARSCLRVCYAL